MAGIMAKDGAAPGATQASQRGAYGWGRAPAPLHASLAASLAAADAEAAAGAGMAGRGGRGGHYSQHHDQQHHDQHHIPESHPRAESLRIRARLVRGFEDGMVAAEGLLAHGRGEAFDYLLGERTGEPAVRACRAAAAAMLSAERPVISVNGNAAALCAERLVEIAGVTGAALEVNLFYDSDDRRQAIERHLRACGAQEVLGTDRERMSALEGTESARRMVDTDGMMAADVVVVPLEDGDRTEALRRAGKTVVAFDLNPLSRTAQAADITIIDNITRAAGVLASECRALASEDAEALRGIISGYDNADAIKAATRQIMENMEGRAPAAGEEEVGRA